MEIIFNDIRKFHTTTNNIEEPTAMLVRFGSDDADNVFDDSVSFNTMIRDGGSDVTFDRGVTLNRDSAALLHAALGTFLKRAKGGDNV